MRDIFTNKITTKEHWNMLMRPTGYSPDEVAYDVIVGNDTIVTPSYDPHCLRDVSNGCHPKQVISAERLVELDTGPEEGRKIALALTNRTGIAEYLISEEAWPCIWTEWIVNKKGVKTFIDREGLTERQYSFSEEMLEHMILELDRLIDKYNSTEWNYRHTSRNLVELFEDHRFLIQTEYDELVAAGGTRALKQEDFLGPRERKRRAVKALEDEVSRGIKNRRTLASIYDGTVENQHDYSDFYKAVNKQLLERRRGVIKNQVFEDDRNRRKWEQNR